MLKPTLIYLIVVVSWATQSISGTWSGAMNSPVGECTYVPRGVACLSECALSWIKGEPKYLDGMIGFHMPWDKQTGKIRYDYNDKMYSFMKIYGWGKWFKIVQKHTSPSKFLIFEKQTEVGKFMSTKQIKRKGYKVVDTSEILKCNSRIVRD